MENLDHSLPKVAVRVRTDERQVIDSTGFPDIVIDGEVLRAARYQTESAAFLFGEMPVLNTVYRMLREDLTEQYQGDRGSLWLR